MLTDAKQRHLATDPSQSFIVQAPAGSGKTELLTQRYLRLLAQVEKPEHVVAITFTKKAAAEMKARIIAALERVSSRETPKSEHQIQTHAYASAILARDASLGWDLLKQAHRLRIMTIDAFCHMLSHAMPVLEKELPFAQINDAPQSFYLQAARNTIRDALTDTTRSLAMQTLLTHLDNRQDLLLTLFTNLLACRDQWLEIILSARQLTQDECETTLYQIEQHTLERLMQATPEAYQEECRFLSQQVAFIEQEPESPRHALQSWCTFNDLTKEQAQALSLLWLTQDNQLRKGFDHHVGFRKNQCAPQTYSDLKQRSQALSETLSQNPDWIALLALIKDLPDPHYDPAQWEVLQALFTLLPFLAAELHLIFQENNALDFMAVAQQAIHALGDEDNPSDLTLHLDYAIHHLLIDEFQDTSLQQMRLLERLTQGWSPTDGRTLFVVGDPMQSIYRFRQAEVGLFLKARHEGIGSIVLTPLHLSCNFRSQANIIDWINQQFQHIFPQQEDIQSGAIAFHPSTAVHPESPDSLIQAWALENKIQEAQQIVMLIKETLAQYPDENIAILVRSRNQLSEIVPAFKKNQIPFQGVEIEKLSSLAHIRDIWTLTQALLYPANRLAWLALLRSPWCGLSLSELLAIAEYNPNQSIFENLANITHIATLTSNASMRAQFIHSVMASAIEKRHQQSLTDMVIHAAQQLHATILFSPEQRHDFEQFFQLLDKHEKNGRIADLETFQKNFDSLYSKRATTARLQIMTIHKSKGLEFDTVILPGLGSKPKPQDNPLFRWLKLPAEHHEQCLLLSPIHSHHQKADKLYDYLGEIEKEKALYETQRLLYVAATRAKKRLYLLDYQDKSIKGSLRHLLKCQVFETLSTEPDEQGIQNRLLPTYERLPDHFYESLPTLPNTSTNRLRLPTHHSHARIQGIIAHELLQWICTVHPSIPCVFPEALFALRARAAGFDVPTTEIMHGTLTQQINTMLASPIGQWICQQHQNEQNEFELLTREHGRANTYIIDRTFEDAGVQWIIDYKTTPSPENNLQHHQEQLNRYAELMRERTALPIHCGIYYLATQEWVGWVFSSCAPLKNPCI